MRLPVTRDSKARGSRTRSNVERATMEFTPKASTDSFASSIGPGDDPRLLYKGSIVDINFRPVSDNTNIHTPRHVTVHDLLNKGPKAIVGKHDQQLRWIHLPANNMAWAEALFDRLHQEQLDDPEKSPGGTTKLTRFDRILRDDKWRDVFHGRVSSDVHSRFMTPHATRYSSVNLDDSDSDESEPKWHDANITALFLPYLHWEYYNTWKHRQRHIHRLKNLAASRNAGSECGCMEGTDDEGDDNYHGKRRESLLLHQDLFRRSPVHDRRSLDQSYFYNLRNVGVEDKDQVIGQNTWNHLDPYMTDRKMMMVDQLWLWVVDGKTIVTAFPESGKSWQKKADIMSLIHDSLHDAVQEGTVKSLNSFIAFLIDQCTGVFHRSDINPDLAFFELVADEIGKAKNTLEKMYETFHATSRSIEAFWTNQGTTVRQMSTKLDVLFSIKDEIRLISDVERVISDLDKIDFLCSQQEETVRNLIKCTRQSRSLNNLIEILHNRRESWAGMAQSAKSTRESLHSLLDLKQRQATVGEARSVRYQIELSAKQGRSIMLLTVFTVFFMPISVMATIFGMNATELNDGKIAFSTISAIAFPTTITLVMVALGFAFSEESRNVTKAFWRNLSRRLVQKSKFGGSGNGDDGQDFNGKV